jgi:hypothetical protein
MKRVIVLSVLGLVELAASVAAAQGSIGIEGSAAADGDSTAGDATAEGAAGTDGATPGSEEAASEATPEAAAPPAEEAASTGPKIEISTVADEPATKETTKTQGSDPIAFGGVYTFGQTGGHTMGIPHGTLGGLSHGLHTDYRNTGLMLSGDTWIDTGYRATETDLLTTVDGNESEFTQQGRFMLRVTPTYSSGNWFVKAQGEILALSDAETSEVYTDTDDAWVMFGYWDLFDLQLGRFEAWEVYHKGMGLERNTLEDQGATPANHSRDVGQVDMYEVNHMLYRQDGLGQAAVHVYPTDFVRLEVETVMGLNVDLTTRCPTEETFRPAADAGPTTGPQQTRQSCFFPWGVRPAAILDFDFVKLKAAWERLGLISRRETDAEVSSTQVDQLLQGFGGNVQFILNPHVELGGGFAQGTEDRYDSTGALNRRGTVERTTFGGFLNARLEIISPLLSGFVIGGGFNQTERLSQDCGPISVRDPVTGNPILDMAGLPVTREGCGEQAHTQYFAAIQHDVLERATIKLVVGLADADIKYGPDGNSIDEKTKMFSVRARALVWY